MAEARVASADTLQCCAPLALVKQCSNEDIHKSRLFAMVKISCTFSGCDQSGSELVRGFLVNLLNGMVGKINLNLIKKESI